MDAISQTLWKNVAPLVFFWMITPEIAKLKDFLDLFARLNFMQQMKVIWHMTQPKDFFLFNSPRVEAIYDCISCSPQLRLNQTKMCNIGNRFLLSNLYEVTKQNITSFLNFAITCEPEHYILEMITHVIQMASPAFVEELYYHYNDIWTFQLTWPENLPRCALRLPGPYSVSIKHRRRLNRSLRSNPGNGYIDMIYLQSLLKQDIVKHRTSLKEQLTNKIHDQLSELRQVLKTHPLCT